MSNKKIGLLVPSGNVAIEPDFYRHITDEDVTIHSMRMYGEKRTKVESFQNIDEINSSVEFFSKVLNHAEPDIIVYGFTTGSFYRGLEYTKELEDRISKCTGKHAISAANAVNIALRSIKAKKISIVTPYLHWNNTVLNEFFKETDYDVLGIHGDERPTEIAKVDRFTHKNKDFAINWITKSYDKACDTILLPCTAWKTYECITELEKTLNKKIVTSNQALLWYCANYLKFSVDTKSCGSLFQFKPVL